jgi:LysM repeat protein
MAKRPILFLLGLAAVLAALAAGCAKYSDYQANMTYVNNDLLIQEEELARGQLHEARARYESALRAGPVAPGAEVEKTFFEARDKYLVIKKEKELRKGRVLTTKDLASDPELAIPMPPSAAKRHTGASPAASDAPDGAATPGAPDDAAPPAATPPAPGDASRKSGTQDAMTPQSVAETTYTVQKGDTLGAIAKKHQVTLAALTAHNALASQNTITPGQVLKIPPR